MTLEEKFRAMSVGDKIWVEHTHSWAVHKFVRVTKTLLITESPQGNEGRFDIKSGRKKGQGKWEFTYAKPFTEAHSEVVMQYKLYRRAQKALELLDKKVSNNKDNLDGGFVVSLEEMSV